MYGLAPFQIHCLGVICWCKIDLRWSCAHVKHLAGSMKSGAVCSMPVHAHHFATRNDKKSAFSSHFPFGQGFLIIVLGVQPLSVAGQQKLPLLDFPDAILWSLVCIRWENYRQKWPTGKSGNGSEVFLPAVLPSFHLLIPKMSAVTQLKAARNCHVFGTVGGFLSSSGDVACGRCPLSSSHILYKCKYNFCYTKLFTSISLHDCICRQYNV